MIKPLRVLILEDNLSDVLILLRELQRNDFDVDHIVVDNADTMSSALEERQWDVILSDFSMPGFDALAALKILHEHALDIPFIIISGTVGEDTAVLAMKAGAQDFFVKGNVQRLTPAVERELREAQQRRRQHTVERMAQATVDALSASIAILDETGKIISVNQAWIDFAEENAGDKSKNAFLGENYLTVCDNIVGSDMELASLVSSCIRKVINSEREYCEIEYPCHSPTEKRWFTVKVTRFQVDASLRIVVTHENITSRKQAEEQIKRSNVLISLLRDIAFASNEANSIAGILQFTIDRVCAYTGWDVGHAYIVPDKGDNLEAPPIWHITDGERFKDFRHYTETTFDATHNLWIRGALASNELQWIEDLSQADEFVRADIATRCGLQSAYAFPIISHQKITGVFEFFSTDKPDNLAREIVDIATHAGTQVGRVIERKRAEKVLYESEKQFRLLAENSTDMISRHTPEGIFLYTSPACRTLLGYEPEELVGQSAYEFFHPDDLAKVINSHRYVLEVPDVYTVEYRIRRKNGLYIWFETTSHSIRSSENNEVIEIHTSSQDVTERKQSETSLERYAKRLQLLHQIDQAILRADDPHAISHAVLPRLLGLIDVHSASITLFDLEREEYTVLATTSPVPEYLKEGSRHKFGNSELIKFFEKNEVQIVNDLHESQNLSLTDKSLVNVQIRSCARIPLIAHGKLMGSINFRSTEPHAFNLEKLDIAREVSAQLAIAIASAHLLEIEQRHNNELTALHQASLHLTRTFDLDSILDTIIDYAILLIKTSDAHIFLYDGEKLTFGAAQWNGKKQNKAFAEPHPQGLTYRVAQSGQRIVVNNMSEDPIFAGTSYAGAIIGLPLLMADTVIGVMTLAFDDTHYFEEQELRILELLADQAAIALHNSQLYEQIRLHNEELEQRVKARTREFKEVKDRVEAILNNTSDAIILADSDGKIYQTNPGFDSQFGYEGDTLFKQHLRTIVASEYVEQVNTAVQNVREQESTQRLGIVVKRKNKTPFPADALFASFREGDSIGIVCSLRDISLQKQVEEELRKALQKEKELNELKTSFTTIVSHEFRTPLAVILSSADTLSHYYDRITEDRRHQKLTTIIKQVHRLTEMINDVLMITRSETVGFECNPQSLNLIALCKELLEEAQIGHGEVGVTVDFTHPGIPESVVVDEFLFSHILQNLTSNAIKYSHKGGKVYVNLKIEDEELVLQVEDEGIGIPESYKSKLFESFQRASNVANIPGTGIGLTIVKRAVDAHDGAIDVESQEGIGTTFTVTLPVAKEHFDED